MSPDALTGPGRAMQGLGRAIAGLGGAFEGSSEPSDDERYQANLELVRFQNEQDLAEANRQATFTGDPEGYSDSSVGEFDSKREELLGRLPQNPKIQQQAMLHTERMRGSRHERAFGFERTQKRGKLISTIEETASQEVAMSQPGNTDQITAKIRGAEIIIDQAPDLTPAEKAALRDKVTGQGVQRILEGTPPHKQRKVVDGLVEQWTRELQPIEPGQAPQQGQPGSPSGPAADRPGEPGFKPDLTDAAPIEFADPPLKRVAGRGTRDPATVKGIVFHQTWGSDNMAGNGSWSNQKNTGAHYYIGKDGKVYNWAGDDVVMRHIQGGRKSADNARPDLTDDNAIGIEIMTRPNERPNPTQVKVATALARQLAQKYGLDPAKDAYGHGELTRKNYRRSDEAIEVVQALRNGSDPKMALGAPGSAADTGEGIKVEATAYAPQKGGDKMEGSYAAARPGPDGKAEVRTLADVAAGRSQYVTIAGDKSQFGKSYTIPEISFVDKDGKTQTLKNVKAVVHDTGSAFKGKGEGRYDIPIDRDASDKQMQASHGLWKQAGLRFMPEGQQEAAAPVSQRGLTSYAGLTNPEAPKGVQVADASGAVPQSAMPGRGENTIPGAPPQPLQPVAKPTIRGAMIERLLKLRPQLVEAEQRALGAMIEQAEKSAGEGFHLPDTQRQELRNEIIESGDERLLQRLDAAEAAAEYTQSLRMGNLDQVKGEAQRLREELNQGGGTPESIARTKAVEGLAASMEKGLADDSIGYAEKAGTVPPVEAVTPDNFTVDALLQRKAVADGIGQKYGMEYRQFFRNGEEKAAIEAAFTKGGDDMVGMLATMYEAFGDDTPKAVAEIAPKNPEAVRAALLASTGGDPKAVKDIADTILRRKEETYAGAPKFEKDDQQADIDKVMGDLFKEDRARRDEIVATAKAIYENRVTDPATYEPDLFRETLGLALGQRKGVGTLQYGGVMTQKGTDWDNPYAGANSIQIPSNIRRDMWNAMLDNIKDQDLVAAGHPMPADSNGKPMSVLRALSYGTFKQVAPNKYMIWRDATPNSRERGGYLMTAAAQKENPDEISTTDIVASAKQGGGDAFVLDLGKLTPIMRAKMPGAFWKE